ncbi:nicotine blue oxidoreductase [Micromonospora kangleipakensis]|uniref:Nicotine blue oxidoreductase n=1 Tax=Micromonospora kangleipakensis TaxID=1077942 RepID=A0A4Q8BCM8_9ACTN|nr:nucleotidyltransferase family protein [Micromonospora kangleipakensis]RZU75015.1 nicotine blue oxidoreductase [Micromonospora kangleipakensis]
MKECSLSKVAGLVLAAGAGTRYGGPKALVRADDGHLLVEHAAATLRTGGCAPIVVVLGAKSDWVRGEARLADVSLVDNADWKSGMGSSLRAGLAALADADVDGVAVLLVDTPDIGPEAVRRLVVAVDGPGALLTATYGGRRGHPVIIGRDHWAGVAALATGDVGARAYLAAHSAKVRGVPCEDVADDTDLDVVPAENTSAQVKRRVRTRA